MRNFASHIEFFIDRNGVDIICKNLISEQHSIFSETDIDIISYCFDIIKAEYPDAYKALMQTYNKSINFKFLVVKRFLKCNFSLIDNNDDMDSSGSFNLEFVSCPLRGECKDENIICNAKLFTGLTGRELEIVKLIVRDMTDQEIADSLFISVFTVENHRKHILKKLNLHSKSAIVDWAHKNNIVK